MIRLAGWLKHCNLSLSLSLWSCILMHGEGIPSMHCSRDTRKHARAARKTREWSLMKKASGDAHLVTLVKAKTAGSLGCSAAKASAFSAIAAAVWQHMWLDSQSHSEGKTSWYRHCTTCTCTAVIWETCAAVRTYDAAKTAHGR